MLSPGVLRTVTVLLVVGCTKEAAPPPAASKVDAPGSPEAVYRQFMLANLEGIEAKMRPLIVDRPGSDILWKGAYPAEVAALLSAQYRTMDIVRLVETPTKVSLKSTAAPVPMDVVLEGMQWKLDPTPIISFRRRAQSNQ